MTRGERIARADVVAQRFDEVIAYDADALRLHATHRIIREVSISRDGKPARIDRQFVAFSLRYRKIILESFRTNQHIKPIGRADSQKIFPSLLLCAD